MNELLPTEMQNERTLHIDKASTLEMVRIMNEEDHVVPAAISRKLVEIAAAVDCIAERLQHDGRMFYIGAGTSGRLGVLDASECPPTFNVSPTLVQGIIAGGDKALRQSVESNEDDESAGAALLDMYGIGDRDVIVGIAASGNTPFVLGAISAAKERGVKTVGVCCNSNCAMVRLVDYPIVIEVGPEVIQGSTRLKAGTAQKLVLNMLSTCSMIKLGKVYGNMMADMQPNNHKLRERAKRIIMQTTNVDCEKAERYLAESNYNIKCAIIMIEQDVSAEAANEILQRHSGAIKPQSKGAAAQNG